MQHTAIERNFICSDGIAACSAQKLFVFTNYVEFPVVGRAKVQLQRNSRER